MMRNAPLILAFICISYFSFGQQQRFNDVNYAAFAHKAEGYRKMKNTGQALTFGGIGLMIMSIAVLNDASDAKSTIGATSNSNEGNFKRGGIALFTGVGCVASGIPLWVVGGINRGRYRRKIDSLSVNVKASPQSAGFSLCYRF